MDDIRIQAIFLALLGIVIGFLSFSGLLGVTIGTGATLWYLLRKENKQAPGGTSGAMGLTLLVAGGWICVFVPAWITHLLK